MWISLTQNMLWPTQWKSCVRITDWMLLSTPTTRHYIDGACRWGMTRGACSGLVSSLTTRPKLSAVFTSRSITWDSSITANHHTRNKVVTAIKYSLIHYFTILSSGYQKSDYIFYAVLLIMLLSIMFLSNILLCTMFLFISYIHIPTVVYVSIHLTSTWAK